MEYFPGVGGNPAVFHHHFRPVGVYRYPQFPPSGAIFGTLPRDSATRTARRCGRHFSPFPTIHLGRNLLAPNAGDANGPILKRDSCIQDSSRGSACCRHFCWIVRGSALVFLSQRDFRMEPSGFRGGLLLFWMMRRWMLVSSGGINHFNQRFVVSFPAFGR